MPCSIASTRSTTIDLAGFGVAAGWWWPWWPRPRPSLPARYPPTRTAIADRLGIGAVRFTVDSSNPSSPPDPGTPGPIATTPAQQALAEAQAEASFPIRLPDPASAGAPVHVEAEPAPAVPGGLVSVAF